jgi:hypothetical protein
LSRQFVVVGEVKLFHSLHTSHPLLLFG